MRERKGMMSKLRIGIIGCGGMAKAHASRFSKIHDRVDVTVVVDLEKERAEAVGELLPGSPKVTTDYREILDDVDAMLIVLPHHLHHPVGINCLNAGKHVLVEKPLANTEQECLDMIETAKRNNRVLMVAYCMRFHPLVIKMKELLDNKVYGDIFQLSIWTEQHTEREPQNWVCRAGTVGGGQFFSHGCHYVDLMLWMLGKPVRGIHLGTNRGTPWMEKEGTSNVTIEFEGGILGYHFGTWGARGTRLGYAFHAHCTKGMIEADFGKGKLVYLNNAKEHIPDQVSSPQQETVLMEVKHAKQTDVEMDHFIDCIETDQKPLTDAVSSLEGLQVMWKLYEAEENHTLAELKGLGLGTLKI